MMGKKTKLDVPGDTVASARQVTIYWYEVGLALGSFDRYREIDHLDAPTLTAFNVKCDPEDPQGVLIVVKGLSEDGPVVAFHRDESVVDAVQGVGKRLQNHTLKWRKDEYG